MTIAACFVLPEGVVLGADSTASAMIDSSGFHYFNHNQKIFEVGEGSTLAALTWGLGGIGASSHRTQLALLSDSLQSSPAKSVAEVASRWTDQFWDAFLTSSVGPLIQRGRALMAKAPFVAGPPNQNSRSEAEENELLQLRQGLPVGFCIAGYVLPDRTPTAFQIVFDPLANKPAPIPIGMGRWSFWGAPNIISRLILGRDEGLKGAVMSSGKWSGTEPELDGLLNQFVLQNQLVPPIREGIDFVYSCIATTIKAMKFSSLSQICGGPIEIAVITTDRKFRWVRHKPWDTAITEGDP